MSEWKRGRAYSLCMRALAGLAVLVFVTLACSTVAAGADSKPQPRVFVVDRTPLVVRGLSFDAGERVLVRAVVRGGARAMKTAFANRSGVFSMRFANLRVRRCAFVTVQATGAHGNRATFTQMPPLCGAS